jgi:hypothetical protein
MAVAMSNLVGTGIYTVPDAARLSKVSSRRIRYWLQRAESEGSRTDVPDYGPDNIAQLMIKLFLGSSICIRRSGVRPESLSEGSDAISSRSKIRIR